MEYLQDVKLTKIEIAIAAIIGIVGAVALIAILALIPADILL